MPHAVSMMRFHLLFTCNKEVEKERERSDVGTRQNVRREHFLIDGCIYKRPPRIESRDLDFSFSEISSYFSKRLNTNGATNRTCRLHRSAPIFLPSRYIHVDWLTLDHRQVMNISQEQDLPIGRFRLLTRMSHYRAKQHLAIREAMRGKMIMSTRPTRYWANASPPGRRATLEEGHL